ncbi:hypothetical protein ANN_24105 [Periplaneta americana]|uniref:Uncharacterized protein n=1 Tax=Periplaneta americana TaxID=6978 RepID=A0ABQ8S2P1_PERAM|nr:hypothetical protein ANN_24105 [Periplaneta americana]
MDMEKNGTCEVDRIRNEGVLERVGEEGMMLKLIRNRKRNWLRRNCLLKDVLEGMVNGRRVRCRRRYQMIDDINILNLPVHSLHYSYRVLHFNRMMNIAVPGIFVCRLVDRIVYRLDVTNTVDPWTRIPRVALPSPCSSDNITGNVDRNSDEAYHIVSRHRVHVYVSMSVREPTGVQIAMHCQRGTVAWLFNDAVSTTRLFSVDEIGDSEMIFGEMRPRIRQRLPCIHITVGENLGKNPTRKRNHISETHYTMQCLLHCLKTSNATAALDAVRYYAMYYEVIVQVTNEFDIADSSVIRTIQSLVSEELH